MAALRQPCEPKRQSGVVLLVAMVFLLVLTVAGLSAMRLANVEERMTGNYGDRNLAFQAAEAALSAAEAHLYDANFSTENFVDSCVADVCFVNDCTDGYCFGRASGGGWDDDAGEDCNLDSINQPSGEIFQQAAVWDDADRHRTIQTQMGGGQSNVEVKYIIEFRCFVYQEADTNADEADDDKYSTTYWEPLYRITALAEGRTGSGSRVMLQSLYRRE